MFVVFALVLVSFVIIGLTKYILHMQKMESYVKDLPSAPYLFLPFIGHGHAIIRLSKDIFNVLDVIFCKSFDSPVKTYLGPMLLVTTTEPDDIKALLTSNSCLSRPYIFELLPNKTGIASIISKKLLSNLFWLLMNHILFPIEDGAEWKPIRKLLNAAFNLKIIQSFFPIFNDKTKILVENLNAEIDGSKFNILKYMYGYDLETVCGE